jgi:hypothetical protein
MAQLERLEGGVGVKGSDGVSGGSNDGENSIPLSIGELSRCSTYWRGYRWLREPLGISRGSFRFMIKKQISVYSDTMTYLSAMLLRISSQASTSVTSVALLWRRPKGTKKTMCLRRL